MAEEDINLLLIDADVLRYRIGFAAQHKKFVIWEKGSEKYGPVYTSADKDDEKLSNLLDGDDTLYMKEYVVAEHKAKCLHSVKLQLQSMLNKFGLEKDDARLYLSGKDNFRDTLVDYYKANRDRAARPLHYPTITEYLIEYWDALVVDGYEADDALSMAMCANEDLEIVPCICSIDKDLDMVPGWHYNFVKDEVYYMDAADGLRQFYGQMLQGDGADNIPGLFKITGTKAAKKFFDPLVEMEDEKEMWMWVWNVYWAAIKKAHEKSPEAKEDYPNPESLIHKLTEIGQLLWMWRFDEDYWGPPSLAFTEMEVK